MAQIIPTGLVKQLMFLVKLFHDLTRPGPQKRWFSKGNPLISRKSRLVKYQNLAHLRLALFPNSPFELIVGFYMSAPL